MDPPPPIGCIKTCGYLAENPEKRESTQRERELPRIKVFELTALECNPFSHYMERHRGQRK